MKRTLALGLVAIMALAAGCGGTKPATPAPGGSTDSKVIKVGLIAPMTGDVKTFGESTKNGFDLALEQAGKKAGDYTIEPVYGDDRNDATEGKNVATKMITQDGVKAIIGSVTSKVTIPVGEYANSKNVLLISGTATALNVTVDDSGKRKPYVFRACFIDPFQGQVAAKFAWDTLKVKTAAVLYDKGNDYTVGLSEAFKMNFEKLGGKVVSYEAYGKDDSDFSAVLTKVKGNNPDMLYLPDYYQKVSLIGKQAKSMGMNVPMMGGDGWDSSDLDYATMDGNYFTNHYSPDDPRPEVKKFVDEYTKKYGNKPDALAALAYDATNILLAGIKQANTNDTDKVRAAVQGLKDFNTVSGKVSYDANGNPVKAAAIMQVKSDKTYKFVQSVNP
ncbi:MAG TPA: ABC transporter substrate-binding protein [Symbiobacteriaceae bacterium]|nr:ABC transporter substrate-binding protein [Symbiobacteriaceae bacterium]